MIILILQRIRNLQGLQGLIIFTRRPGIKELRIYARDIIVYSVYLEYFRPGNATGCTVYYEIY
jgi:hypothetical protein